MRTACVTQHQVSIFVMETSHHHQVLEDFDMHMVIEDQQPIVTEALRLISKDFHSDVAELCEQLTCDESHKPKQRLSPKSWMFKYRRDHKILHSSTMSRNVRMVFFRKMEAAERIQYLVTHRFHEGPLKMDIQDSEFGIRDVLRRVMMLFQHNIVQAKMIVTKRKKTFYKSRRFKFKHRVVPRALQYGFEVKMKQNLTNKEAELVHILLGWGDVILNLKKKGRSPEFELVMNYTPFSVELVKLKDRDTLLIPQFLLSDEKFQIKHNWKQSDIGTQLLCDRRLVVSKLGSEAMSVREMYQRLYRLAKLKFAMEERKLEVIQSQTFDPGIGLEAQETLKSLFQAELIQLFSSNGLMALRKSPCLAVTISRLTLWSRFFEEGRFVVGNEHQMRKLRGGQRLVYSGETRGRITLGEAGESFYGDSLKGSLCFFSLLC